MNPSVGKVIDPDIAMLWIETRTPEEAEQLQKRMWGTEPGDAAGGAEYRVRGEGLLESGEFWADALGKLTDDPRERLKMAKHHLPLPAAFREAAISLRAIIRQNRKQETDYRPALEELYHLAAIWSFCLPYAPRLQQPGYNVLARVPFAEFESMSLTWGTLGDQMLDLLNKTDRRWMREAWGEPQTHTTLNTNRLVGWQR
jgi:hypothetical protein